VKAQNFFAEAQGFYLAKNFDGAAEGFKRPMRRGPRRSRTTAAAYHMKLARPPPRWRPTSWRQYYQKYLGADPAASDKAAVEKTVAVLTAEIERL
jgi:hypothetical protein